MRRKRLLENPISEAPISASKLIASMMPAFVGGLGLYYASKMFAAAPLRMWWTRPLGEVTAADVPKEALGMRLSEFDEIDFPPSDTKAGREIAFDLAREMLGGKGFSEVEVDVWRAYFDALEKQT